MMKIKSLCYYLFNILDLKYNSIIRVPRYLPDIFRVNLCCGNTYLNGWFGIDYNRGCDLRLDLSRNNLPFDDSTCDAIVCMSAINYFTYERAYEIICDCKRVLKKNGIARFGVQDLELIALHYVNRNKSFFFEKLPDGKDRYPGQTIGDKFASWFYSYSAGNSHCKYIYDYESLSNLFWKAGFSVVERKKFQESKLADVNFLDNRPEQMFFLEAIK